MMIYNENYAFYTKNGAKVEYTPKNTAFFFTTPDLRGNGLIISNMYKMDGSYARWTRINGVDHIMEDSLPRIFSTNTQPLEDYTTINAFIQLGWKYTDYITSDKYQIETYADDQITVESIISYSFIMELCTYLLNVIKRNRFLSRFSSNYQATSRVIQIYVISIIDQFIFLLRVKLWKLWNGEYGAKWGIYEKKGTTPYPDCMVITELFVPLFAMLELDTTDPVIPRVSEAENYPRWTNNSCYADALFSALFSTSSRLDTIFLDKSNPFKNSLVYEYYLRNVIRYERFHTFMKLKCTVASQLDFHHKQRNANERVVREQLTATLRRLRSEDKLKDKFTLEPINEILRVRMGERYGTMNDSLEFMDIIFETLYALVFVRPLVKTTEFITVIPPDSHSVNIVFPSRSDIKFAMHALMSTSESDEIEGSISDLVDATIYGMNELTEITNATEIFFKSINPDDLTQVAKITTKTKSQLICMPEVLIVPTNIRGRDQEKNITIIYDKYYTEYSNDELFPVVRVNVQDMLGTRHYYELFSMILFRSSHYTALVFEKNDIVNVSPPSSPSYSDTPLESIESGGTWWLINVHSNGVEKEIVNHEFMKNALRRDNNGKKNAVAMMFQKSKLPPNE